MDVAYVAACACVCDHLVETVKIASRRLCEFGTGATHLNGKPKQKIQVNRNILELIRDMSAVPSSAASYSKSHNALDNCSHKSFSAQVSERLLSE